MKPTLVRTAVLVSAVLAAASAFAGGSTAQEYTITIKNTLAKERLAPILVVGDADDSRIWVGEYVSPEAHTQFTTGNPAPLARKLGGEQQLPGKLAVGGEVTFKFKTSADKARITAMVHPDFAPDNYVTAVLDLKKGGAATLERFDIGDDEGRKTVQKVGPAGTVTIR